MQVLAVWHFGRSRSLSMFSHSFHRSSSLRYRRISAYAGWSNRQAVQLSNRAFVPGWRSFELASMM